MTTQSISKQIEHVCRAETNKEKAALLRKYSSFPMRTILQLMFDNKLVYNISTERPSILPTDENMGPGALYKESRKFKYFVEGWDGDRIPRERREDLFYEMITSVDRSDAELLICMLTRTPPNGLTHQAVYEAFPSFIPKPKPVHKDENETSLDDNSTKKRGRPRKTNG